MTQCGNPVRFFPIPDIAEQVGHGRGTAKFAGPQRQTANRSDLLFEQIPAYLEFFGLPVTTPDELRAVATLQY